MAAVAWEHKIIKTTVVAQREAERRARQRPNPRQIGKKDWTATRETETGTSNEGQVKERGFGGVDRMADG
jgi:hypothetical protein